MKGKMKLKNNSKRIIRKSFFYLVIIYSIFSITFYYSLKNSTKINNTKFINFLLGGGNSHLLEDYKLVNIVNTSTDFLFNIDLKNPSSILDQGILMYGNNEKVLEVSHNDDYSNLEELKKIPCKIGVASGLEKKEALHGALLGGYIDILYADEELGKEILNY